MKSVITLHLHTLEYDYKRILRHTDTTIPQNLLAQDVVSTYSKQKTLVANIYKMDKII